jgi:hypothetical protein|tara:strand:+ start:114 stop:299 length:186 start_codon:yes stop_codon:yes gene_type:complete
MIKKLWIWFIEAIRETLNLTWTLIGLIIAILTLSSSARSITLIATIVALSLWLLTMSFRKS